MQTILAVGQDKDLLFSRSEILRTCSESALVVTAMVEEALDLLDEQRFDLVILCHTLTRDELSRIAGFLHMRGADAKVLRVVTTITEQTPDGGVLLDEEVPADPKSLVEKVEKALRVDPAA